MLPNDFNNTDRAFKYSEDDLEDFKLIQSLGTYNYPRNPNTYYYYLYEFAAYKEYPLFAQRYLAVKFHTFYYFKIYGSKIGPYEDVFKIPDFRARAMGLTFTRLFEI